MAVLASVAELVRAMGATPLLRDAPADSVERLASTGVRRDYRRGTYLFHQGDEARDVLFIVAGRVEVSTTSLDGHRQLHTAIDPGQFFGELGPLGNGRRTSTAEAIEDTTVWVCDAQTFLDYVTEQPSVARALLRALARQIQAHEVLVEDLLFLDLKGRVAKRLLGLVSPAFDDLPEDGVRLPAIITHADLASLAGGSRENVSRILSDFARRGLIDREGRRLVLLDVARARPHRAAGAEFRVARGLRPKRAIVVAGDRRGDLFGRSVGWRPCRASRSSTACPPRNCATGPSGWPAGGWTCGSSGTSSRRRRPRRPPRATRERPTPTSSACRSGSPTW